MATTTFFEEEIKDQGGKATLELEFGRSSFYGNNSFYIRVDGKPIIVDQETAKRIFSSMDKVAGYLNLGE